VQLVSDDPVVRTTATTEIPNLAAIAALPRRPRRATAPTWGDLVAREPRLGELLAAIRAMPRDDPHFCGVRAWFGPKYRGDGLKAKMVALVGWHAENDDPVLSSSEAYQTAYRKVYGALPPCGDCPCGALARALYGAEAMP
jgi:hypothetical protein